ncbi:DUF1302 domain-containing protein [Pseudomonas sp. GCM10022186]|uniref:DUF1302 domain-containing protein n=1 Tax=Pseudomonas sp. GCM10022186 TaxID=3252650 RepID=UPI003617F25D
MARLASVALAPLAIAISAQAAEFEVGEVTGNARGSIAVGATWSAENADRNFINQGNATSIGLGGGFNPNNSTTSDDNRLNFRKKNKLVSSPVTLLGEMDLHYQNYGAFVRGKAWYDYTLENEDVDFGHLPNGYRKNSKLDDSHFDELAKFQGVALLDAYIYGDFELASAPLHLRGGRQVINWGEGLFFQSGINEINPFDLAALVRPGSQLKEAFLPTNMLYANLGVTDNLTLEAFYKLEWRKTVLPGCGTFYAPNDLAPDGCNGMTVLNDLNAALGGESNDASALANGVYVRRARDEDARDGGQFGVAARYYFESIGTEVGAYAMNVHSTVPFFAAQLFGSGFGGDFSEPDAARYLAKFPEDIRIFGLSFNSSIMGTSIFGEYSYRPNQPVGLYSGDFVPAVLDPVTVSSVFGLPLANDVLAATPGSKFNGYDRLETSQLTLGFIKSFQQVLGADSLNLIGESALKYVHDLPGKDERRYGNVDNYGSDFNSELGCQAAVLPQYQRYGCSGDGFVSKFSWGYRVNAELSYLNAVAGVNLTPYVSFGHDVKGWSHDGELVEDRLRGTVGLRADYAKKYTVDVSWSGSGNTRYALTDRDFFALSARMSF